MVKKFSKIKYIFTIRLNEERLKEKDRTKRTKVGMKLYDGKSDNTLFNIAPCIVLILKSITFKTVSTKGYFLSESSMQLKKNIPKHYLEQKI